MTASNDSGSKPQRSTGSRLTSAPDARSAYSANDSDGSTPTASQPSASAALSTSPRPAPMSSTRPRRPANRSAWSNPRRAPSSFFSESLNWK
jgi:hypothetical protein